MVLMEVNNLIRLQKNFFSKDVAKLFWNGLAITSNRTLFVLMWSLGVNLAGNGSFTTQSHTAFYSNYRLEATGGSLEMC
jgi:hypothetical protein